MPLNTAALCAGRRVKGGGYGAEDETCREGEGLGRGFIGFMNNSTRHVLHGMLTGGLINAGLWLISGFHGI